MCSEVSEQQRALKEDETRRPDRGRAAEQRKQSFSGDRLDEEEHRAAQKNCDRVRNCRISGTSGGGERSGCHAAFGREIDIA